MQKWALVLKDIFSKTKGSVCNYVLNLKFLA